jgi:hypothetical protein
MRVHHALPASNMLAGESACRSHHLTISPVHVLACNLRVCEPGEQIMFPPERRALARGPTAVIPRCASTHCMNAVHRDMA